MLLLMAFTSAHTAKARQQNIFSDSAFIYTLVLDSLDDGCMVRSITVTDKRDGAIIQTLTSDENRSSWDFPPEQLFIIEDMNFNNHNDIRLLQFVPAGPNLPYYCRIYIPSTGRFIRDTLLEEITSPEFDPENKLVISTWWTSCCDRGTSTYGYINGRITLIDEVEIADDPKRPRYAIFTHRKLVKGKMKEVERIRGPRCQGAIGAGARSAGDGPGSTSRSR